jgi:hypothetical protein
MSDNKIRFQTTARICDSEYLALRSICTRSDNEINNNSYITLATLFTRGSLSEQGRCRKRRGTLSVTLCSYIEKAELAKLNPFKAWMEERKEYMRYLTNCRLERKG